MLAVAFWLCCILLVYVYAIYPVLVRVLARRFGSPLVDSSFLPSITIIVTVYNEERCIAAKLENLLGLDYPRDRYNVLVVSDGSTDRTGAILREHAHNPRVQVLMNQLGRGKACGLNDAVSVATGEVVIFTDVRQKIETSAIRLLMESFADPEVGCVSGALMLGDAESGEAAKGMGLYWRIEKKIRELESDSGSVVGATGALYAVRRELLTSVPEGTILDDVYIPMQVVRQGKRVIFEPRARAWDSPDLGAEREFARKVRTLSGNYQLVQLAPWLLTSKNPVRFEFVSHKLLRLAVPFALAAVLTASVFLSGVLYRTALALQVAFYGLSLLAGLRLTREPWAGMADAALTFVVLNTAAAVAFVNFLTGRKAVWIR